ncbi:MAG TPA: hypothetical protein VI322_04805 [Candidatus Saccharimonadia bacterium]
MTGDDRSWLHDGETAIVPGRPHPRGTINLGRWRFEPAPASRWLAADLAALTDQPVGSPVVHPTWPARLSPVALSRARLRLSANLNRAAFLGGPRRLYRQAEDELLPAYLSWVVIDAGPQPAELRLPGGLPVLFGQRMSGALIWQRPGDAPRSLQTYILLIQAEVTTRVPWQLALALYGTSVSHREALPAADCPLPLSLAQGAIWQRAIKLAVAGLNHVTGAREKTASTG